jgi:hypothetical protein
VEPGAAGSADYRRDDEMSLAQFLGPGRSRPRRFPYNFLMSDMKTVRLTATVKAAG